VTSSRCVFLSKVLIIQANATHSSSKRVSYYTALIVSSVQISHHQVDVGYTKEYILRVPQKI